MRFLSLVKSAENQGPAPQVLQDAMGKLIADSLANGSLIQTGGLGASAGGFRIRAARGKLTVTDGPFAETKDVIGGYAVLEWASRAAAVENALAFMRLHTEHWPSWEGECEVRPINFLAP
jgi:hypothetical protein